MTDALGGRRRPRRQLRGDRPISKLSRCLGLVLAVSMAPAEAQTVDEAGPASARAIIEEAHRAAGGDTWRTLRTLQLEGRATFFNGGQASAARADSYRMWRVLPDRSARAHAANGMVRFDAQRGEQTLFQISFDGEHSYNQDGLIEDAAASERWKSNFGFGIIRFALEPGFTLRRMADDSIDGHGCYFVEVSDPSGQRTLFAIDRDSYAVRMVGFDTPRGFHHRIYDDFSRREGIAFTQPGHVRLYYDGVKTADIRWTDFRINEPLDRSRFVLTQAP